MTGEIECACLADAIKVLEELKDRATHVPVEWPLLRAAEIVEERTVQNFLASEDPEGTPWAPVKRKMPPPILIQTGLLERSAAEAARNPQIDGDTMMIDARTPFYGAFHMVGGVHLAKREWLGFTEAHVDQMTAIACDSAVEFILTGEQA
jgi:phage gpG-like protein